MAKVNVRKKIIAVDDNIEYLTVLKETLKHTYDVYTCPSASKMFEILEHLLPDLILLDVDMPVMNGYEAAKKLKENVKYKSIPFMFLTVRNDIDSEVRGFSLGAVDYIHKPFIARVLLMRIKTHITLTERQEVEIISMAAVTAMNHIREGFALVDIENNYLACNPVMTKMLPGITKLKKGDSIFFAKGWPEELNSIENGSVEFSITNGRSRFYRACISPVFIENKTFIGRIFLFTDITENVNFLSELEKTAFIDDLTGLNNSRHFMELADAEIQRAIRLNHPVYTVMVDIDHLRKINETYGHTAGDMVLKSAADIIRQTIRTYDLIGHYGGEKFVILLAISDENEIYNMAEKIRENVEHVFTVYEGDEIKVTCSVGVAKLQKNDTLKSVIQKADEALCVAKNSGCNQIKMHDDKLYE